MWRLVERIGEFPGLLAISLSRMTNSSPHEEARNVHVVALPNMVLTTARIDLRLNLHLVPQL